MQNGNNDLKLDLPLDLYVIGGGLAGLSCAIRARFIKSYGAYPMSVAVVESAPRIGGLANLGNIKITGPQFNFQGAEIISKLKADADFYDIPVINEKVVSITKNMNTGLFEIETGPEKKKIYTSKTVCICSGMRSLQNEWEFFGRGIKITYMGYDKIHEMIRKSIAENADGDFLIYGNEYSKNLINFVKSALKDKYGNYLPQKPIFLINSDENKFKNEKIYKQDPQLFEFGKIINYEGRGSLETIKISASGKIINKPLKCLLLDYNSFEIRPDFDIKIIDLNKNAKVFFKKGFIKVDREMRTKIKGLFAAGDITGLYFCASRAISEGIIAAFTAYREVMKIKNVKAHSLFAYSPVNKIYDGDYDEIPDFDLTKNVITLSKEPAVRDFFVKYYNAGISESNLREVLTYFEFYKVLNSDDFIAIQNILKINEASFRRMLSEMIKAKLITIY